MSQPHALLMRCPRRTSTLIRYESFRDRVDPPDPSLARRSQAVRIGHACNYDGGDYTTAVKITIPSYSDWAITSVRGGMLANWNYSTVSRNISSLGYSSHGHAVCALPPNQPHPAHQTDVDVPGPMTPPGRDHSVEYHVHRHRGATERQSVPGLPSQVQASHARRLVPPVHWRRYQVVSVCS